MKIHPFYQVAKRFWLKRGQSGVADLTEEEKEMLMKTKYLLENHLKENSRSCTHAYASKSPLLIASISCSVILMISCLRTAEDGRNTSEAAGEVPKQRPSELQFGITLMSLRQKRGRRAAAEHFTFELVWECISVTGQRKKQMPESTLII